MDIIVATFRPIILSIVALTLAGCAASSNVSGGMVGSVQDRVLYKAENDFDYLYRAMGVTATLAKIATNNTKNAGNTKQAIAQMNGLVESLSAMAQSPCGAVMDGKAAETCADETDRIKSACVNFDGSKTTP